MIITRRSFLRGLLAAPIIVAAPSLMKVRALPRQVYLGFDVGMIPPRTLVWRIDGLDADGRLIHEDVTVRLGGHVETLNRWRHITSIEQASA